MSGWAQQDVSIVSHLLVTASVCHKRNAYDVLPRDPNMMSARDGHYFETHTFFKDVVNFRNWESQWGIFFLTRDSWGWISRKESVWVCSRDTGKSLQVACCWNTPWAGTTPQSLDTVQMHHQRWGTLSKRLHEDVAFNISRAFSVQAEWKQFLRLRVFHWELNYTVYHWVKEILVSWSDVVLVV